MTAPAPIFTREFAGALTVTVPLAGAGMLVVAFSVSSSNRSSSWRTYSPFCLNQRTIVPSVIDSPTDGTVISTIRSAPK